MPCPTFDSRFVSQTDVAVAHTSYPSCLECVDSPPTAEDPAPLFSERDWNGVGLAHFAILHSSDNPADVVC